MASASKTAKLFKILFWCFIFQDMIHFCAYNYYMDRNLSLITKQKYCQFQSVNLHVCHSYNYDDPQPTRVVLMTI